VLTDRDLDGYRVEKNNPIPSQSYKYLNTNYKRDKHKQSELSDSLNSVRMLAHEPANSFRS